MCVNCSYFVSAVYFAVLPEAIHMQVSRLSLAKPLYPNVANKSLMTTGKHMTHEDETIRVSRANVDIQTAALMEPDGK